jgi:hypothetical protein
VQPDEGATAPKSATQEKHAHMFMFPYKQLDAYEKLLDEAEGVAFEGQPNAWGFKGLWQNVYLDNIVWIHGRRSLASTLGQLERQGFYRDINDGQNDGVVGSVLIASLLSDRPQG